MNITLAKKFMVQAWLLASLSASGEAGRKAGAKT
jgi:hypothetical protein